MAITIEDLRNPKRKSGFDHVNSSLGGPKSGAKLARWRASKGAKIKGRPELDWKGQTRRTPEEAAQDYCDYINGSTAVVTPKLNFPGHAPRDTSERSAEEEEALRILKDIKAQRESRQGYVYCIAEVANPVEYVKIGYSVKPEARVGELQTGNARLLTLLAKKEGTKEDEAALHMKYIDQNTYCEWFEASDELLAEFNIESTE